LIEPTKSKQLIFDLIRLSFLLSDFVNQNFKENLLHVNRIIAVLCISTCEKISFTSGESASNLDRLVSLHIFINRHNLEKSELDKE